MSGAGAKPPAVAFERLAVRIELREATLVAAGRMRLVYETDRLPGMLVKVIRPELIDADGYFNGKVASHRFKRLRRVGAFAGLKRELVEQIGIAKAPRALSRGWPIVRIFGFVETDMGMGVAVEKLTDEAGRLAPSLGRLVGEGRFLPAHREALLRFFEDLERLHVCMSDVHARNIVFAGGLPEGRFVAVDGYGAKGAIPLASWSHAVNAYRIRRYAGKILSQIDAEAS